MGPVDRIRARLASLGALLVERLAALRPRAFELQELDVWGGPSVLFCSPGYFWDGQKCVALVEPDPVPEWAPVPKSIGVHVRNPKRAYATAKTRGWVRDAGLVAVQVDGELQVADVSGPEPGPFPPHVSHAAGRDLDVAYRLDTYPTPADVPASQGFLAVMSAMRDGIETIGVSIARKAELEAMAASLGWPLPKLSAWPGHQTHAHVRLRP